MKKNRFCTIYLKKKRDLFDGIFIREGKEWLLMNSCFVDYEMDGFSVICKKKIESKERNKNEKFIETVLVANDKIIDDTVKGLPLADSLSLFRWMKKRDLLIEIFVENKSTSNIGKICKILDGVIYLHLLSNKGKWLEEDKGIKMSAIEVVRWNTDYINSLYKYNIESTNINENVTLGNHKLHSISIKGWRKNIYGVFENEGNEWIILNNLFNNFMLDGIKAVNKKYIEAMKRGDSEIFRENVLKANGRLVEIDSPDSSLLNTRSLLAWLKNNNVLIGFSMGDQTVMYVGIIDTILEKSFYIKELTFEGEWEKERRLFRIDSLRTIGWDSDYLNSLIRYSSYISGK